ncbi:hypothetical protein ABZ642_08285 [Streptomyces sp. NPDC007157]
MNVTGDVHHSVLTVALHIDVKILTGPDKNVHVPRHSDRAWQQ